MTMHPAVFLLFGMIMYWSGILVQKYILTRKKKQRYFLVTTTSTVQNTTFNLTYRYNATDGCFKISDIQSYVNSEIRKVFPDSNHNSFSVQSVFEMTEEQYLKYIQ